MNKYWLREAHSVACRYTGCTKVSVGSVITKGTRMVSSGANRAVPNLCKGHRGCLRVELHGTNSKEFRTGADCRAIHSEIDAIASATVNLVGATIYITRYPCESCARAIVASGIIKVVYGRQQEISELTKEIFDYAGVEVIWEKDFIEEDVLW